MSKRSQRNSGAGKPKRGRVVSKGRAQRARAKGEPERPTAGKGVRGQAAPVTEQVDQFGEGAWVVERPRVVAIGASAGGVEAFKAFFSNLPPDTGLAFVIAQHLKSGQKSGMVNLLRTMTPMDVVEATDGMPIEANRLHMIPPGQLLWVEDGHLRLTTAPEGHHWSPVDHLFTSLAKTHGAQSIAIEMSGMGTDGAKGMAAIRAAGGLVVVQAPESAKSSSMPASVIASGAADIVAPAEQIPEQLLQRLEESKESAASQSQSAENEKALRLVEEQVRARTGHDFSHYKRGTILRRVKRRMDLRQARTVVEYAKGLLGDAKEVEALLSDLLVGVTEFFREPAAWEVLSDLAINPTLRRKGEGEPFRAWVAGCATGQEAYSLGMTLLERSAALNKGVDIKIFASDISEPALSIARAGIYPVELERQVSRQRLERFFERLPGGGYRVKKGLRDLIVFAQQSLIADAPFSKLDLITCRNVLIYLEPALQRQILNLFHFALGKRGFLFLGSSESVTGFESRFRPVSKKLRIYQRADGPGAGPAVELPLASGRTAFERRHLDAAFQPPIAPPLTRLAAVAQQLVLERFAPASVLINTDFETLYYCGPTHEYLINPTGMPTHNLLDMARSGLRTKLRTAVHKAVKERRAVTISNIRLRRGSRYFPIVIKVTPLHDVADGGELLLVVFQEQAKVSQDHLLEAEGSSTQEESLVRQLEYDLKVTREDLQANLEELEAGNEELKAGHEEMTSMNEELQSTNEELETSKEEMQSLNEELTTVNNQLQGKVEELEATNDDLEHLLISTELATIFLDREFRIRRFTPPTRKLISLTLNDIGRPLTDFAHRVADGDLMKDAQAVLKQLEPTEAEVEGDDGRSYLRRILPYRTNSGAVEGVVITFTDITQRKTYEEHQKMLIAELDHRVKNTMAVVQSMAAQTLRQSRSLEEFGEAYEGRLLAMAKAHSLLSHEHWKGTSLRMLMDKILGPYCGAHTGRCQVQGEDIIVEPKRAMSLTMALHELTTNAVKHGALNNSHGKLAVNWTLDGDDAKKALELSWVERDGPEVKTPQSNGFGTGLIRRCVEYEMNGKVDFDFQPDGFRARIVIPWGETAT